jgi:hypothetical protein
LHCSSCHPLRSFYPSIPSLAPLFFFPKAVELRSVASALTPITPHSAESASGRAVPTSPLTPMPLHTNSTANSVKKENVTVVGVGAETEWGGGEGSFVRQKSRRYRAGVRGEEATAAPQAVSASSRPSGHPSALPPLQSATSLSTRLTSRGESDGGSGSASDGDCRVQTEDECDGAGSGLQAAACVLPVARKGREGHANATSIVTMSGASAASLVHQLPPVLGTVQPVSRAVAAAHDDTPAQPPQSGAYLDILQRLQQVQPHLSFCPTLFIFPKTPLSFSDAKRLQGIPPSDVCVINDTPVRSSACVSPGIEFTCHSSTPLRRDSHRRSTVVVTICYSPS